ncbi:SLAM family member 8-like [Hyperolius riggenbachi]|uniref:SLAM family member 8-like n=1 Tax=Hyperolius riggenbachi TaxID=752182 RepID=UPI0035A27143
MATLRRTLNYWMLPLVLLSYTGTIFTAEDVTQITGIRGGSVLLSPVVPPGLTLREIFWRHLSPTDHLVASFSRGFLDTSYQSCFYGRVELLQNFSLEISGLQLRDTGEFICQMVDTEGHMKLHQFYLKVYDIVAKPEIQVFVSKRRHHCSIFLSCNMTTGNNVTYSWRTDTGPGAIQNETYTLLDNNRLLKLILTPRNKNVSFTCIVTNPVRQESTSVIPGSSCSDLPGSQIYSGEIMLGIAASFVLMFALGMFCVLLFTRSSGKAQQQQRQRDVLHQAEEEPLAQENDENNEETTPQKKEEATSLQNGEAELEEITVLQNEESQTGHMNQRDEEAPLEADLQHREEGPVQCNGGTTLIYRMETDV